jgi:hypothetical protein
MTKLIHGAKGVAEPPLVPIGGGFSHPLGAQGGGRSHPNFYFFFFVFFSFFLKKYIF